MTIKMTITTDREKVTVDELLKIQKFVKITLKDRNLNLIWDNIDGTLEV